MAQHVAGQLRGRADTRCPLQFSLANPIKLAVRRLAELRSEAHDTAPDTSATARAATAMSASKRQLLKFAQRLELPDCSCPLKWQKLPIGDELYWLLPCRHVQDVRRL